MSGPQDVVEIKIVFSDGRNRVVKGRAARAILRIIKHEDTINDTEIRGKFWINLQGKDTVETTLDLEL